jgi:L,D-peptidoglycan transpeptidase YkuD (ErfK/YbiS/YcfS/YnhG family)
MPVPRLRRVEIRSRSAALTQGWIVAAGAAWPCSLGRSGRRVLKREGDGATPDGVWHPVEVLYRRDRTVRPATALPVRPLRVDDGWCDATGDRNYNRRVRHPYPASAERLWRDDHVYDVIVVLSHNRVPRIQGRGSAVFMHLARPGHTPTEGCIALTIRDLRLLLARIDRRTRLGIGL